MMRLFTKNLITQLAALFLILRVSCKLWCKAGNNRRQSQYRPKRTYD